MPQRRSVISTSPPSGWSAIRSSTSSPRRGAPRCRRQQWWTRQRNSDARLRASGVWLAGRLGRSRWRRDALFGRAVVFCRLCGSHMRRGMRRSPITRLREAWSELESMTASKGVKGGGVAGYGTGNTLRAPCASSTEAGRREFQGARGFGVTLLAERLGRVLGSHGASWTASTTPRDDPRCSPWPYQSDQGTHLWVPESLSTRFRKVWRAGAGPEPCLLRPESAAPQRLRA